MSGQYNYGNYYGQQQQQGQGSGYRSYGQATPATTASSAYPTYPSSSVSDRFQQSQTPSYGAYNRPAYESRTTSGGLNPPNQQYQTHPSAAQQTPYQQSQSSGTTQQARPQDTSASSHYGQQQARPSSGAPTAARYHTPEQAQQRRANPAYRQTSSNQYSNVRAEAAPQSTSYHNTHSNVTVDPSQVYDASHEYRRQAQVAEAEAAKRAKEQEERRKAEEARKAEEERVQREGEEAERERERAAAEGQRLADQAAKAQAQDGTKAKKPRKPRESTGPAKSKKKGGKAAGGSDINQMQEAALTLMQTANAKGGDQGALEAQMKAMFQKMREFNSKDPEMLSRLWQEERDQHLATQQAPTSEQASQPTPAGSGAAASTPKSKKKKQQQPPPADKEGQAAPAKKSTKATKVSASQPSAAAKPQPAASTSKKPAYQAVTPAQATPAPAKASASAQKPKQASLWPADKKAALSKTASELLKSMAGNEGKTLPPAELASLLDGNPDYIELCDQIESRGVKVDRSTFAKSLITAIPDIERAKAAQQVGSPNGANGAAASSLMSQQTVADAQKRLMEGGTLMKVPKKSSKRTSEATPSRPQKPQPPGTGAPQAQMANAPVDPALGGLEAVQMYVDGQWRDQAPSAPSTLKSKGERKASKAKEPKLSEPAGPPTKYDLSRKRDFSELIDLSQKLSDDEEDVDLWNPPAKRQELDIPPGQNQAVHLPTPPDTTTGGRSPPPPAASAQQMLDPAVSQRPVSAGIPPQTNKQPNANLSFTQPQQPVPPPPKAPVSSAPPLPRNHQARTTIMIKDLDKHKALRRSQYDPRTIARDVLIASGRHPDMRSLNAHLEALRALPFSIDTIHDLSTFRWDMVDPGGPAPGSGAPVPPRPQVAPLDVDADDEDSDDDSVLGRPTAVRRAVDVDMGGSVVGGAGDLPGMTPAPKKKGRPRKSEPIFRAYGDSAPQPPGRLRHSEGVPSSSKGTGTGVYAQLKQQQAGTDPEAPKKRGRPVGWRKYMMADPSSYKGAAENRAPGGKPGRKKKSPSPPQEYQVFKCEWRGCAAELHNLATLRRHVHKLHGKADGDRDFVCAWKGCTRITSTIDEATGRASSEIKSHQFDDIDDLKKHVEDKHINPIAWKLGDGPKDGLSGKHLSCW